MLTRIYRMKCQLIDEVGYAFTYSFLPDYTVEAIILIMVRTPAIYSAHITYAINEMNAPKLAAPAKIATGTLRDLSWAISSTPDQNIDQRNIYSPDVLSVAMAYHPDAATKAEIRVEPMVIKPAPSPRGRQQQK
jgi:hypothetical protein